MTQINSQQQPQKIASIPPIVSVKKFADILKMPVSEVIKELMENGIMATINEEIDFETASIIAQDLGFTTEQDLDISDGEIITLEKLIDICKKEKEAGKNLQERAPIVTILGHVDHGKTTLLDTIRKTSVAAKELGGITQHISAYQARKRGKIITFVDTPGHEAFSAMRERGVSIADIAILVVAADDGVRPQTKEVIKYLKERKIPTLIAINKIDKPEANAQRVKQELAENEIMVEDWGGKYMSVEISAKNNIGIDDLLERVLLLAEVEDLKADAKRDGLAVVLESNLDPKKGPVSTVLVKTGTLKVGQDITAGHTYGRIKRIEDFSGKSIESASPSTPAIIIGLNTTPNVNDIVQVASKKSISKIKSEKTAEKISGTKKDASKQNLFKSIDNEKIKKLNIIIKSDVQGSLEAIEQILSTLKSDEVAIEYVAMGVGNITESDVKVAGSSNAIIMGFNVNATSVAKRMAENSGVEVKTFGIIYELVEDVRSKLSDLLPPEIIRTDFGKLKVLAIFKTGKHDMIIGGRIIEGKAIKSVNIEVQRDGEIIGTGKLTNLQQNMKDTDEVKQGNECGITFDGNIKIKEGDILKFFKEEDVKRKI
ncbi:MAG: Translation initiation factor IF-2 [Candidatus Moranbacteria bacterium GW2011_GWE2_35_2-]|nr:MAG: Translation initiation factor IF-2 [Candidatus Moranbacteria bacterium GW2011_GWE2_35_2-]KKQ05149.1 MAG: Translation initiation factor IF-2 [Candidatus Moranbacteria bacterium GW2011_GWF1_36_4]KKQ22384.1 MAG: Translation initiation factor IF-2 [Candidatus Moranbacteria bacterium GW2011_GWF2_37_11]KKQ29452.1 MAG: Translation initiation factor IF-2 [Candidatus Moranbacteria bacterium GW2011_GWD1_37_17]KKQ30680.1 MAG: Translation initiation factor IF-2 [Candidatus Moranbacteria bacterium G